MSLISLWKYKYYAEIRENSDFKLQKYLRKYIQNTYLIFFSFFKSKIIVLYVFTYYCTYCSIVRALIRKYLKSFIHNLNSSIL